MRLAAVLLTVLLLSGGCGSGTGPGDGPSRAVGERRAAASSPFAVDAVPPTWIPVIAGRGTYGGDWASDTVGSTEPYTVVAPEEGTLSPDAVIEVAYTALDGMTELDQPQFSADDRFGPPHLLRPLGDGTYLRVSGVGRSRPELERIADGAQPVDEVTAPVVEAPPGWRVVGSVDTDAILAAGAGVHAWSDVVPGPPSGHAYGWVRPGGQLAVVAIPSDRVDLPALALRSTATDDVQVVTLEAAWGDVLVATSSGPAAASAEELDAVLASARPVDEAEWRRRVAAASGGPGLRPDPLGGGELARGTSGDVAWLFQAFPGDIHNRLQHLPSVLPTDYHGDPCLKLSTGRRACADQGAFGGTTTTLHVSPDPGLVGPFVVVNTTTEAAAVRLTQGDDVTTVPMVRVPGSVARWAAVVFGADGRTLPAHYPDCEPTRPARLELLDQAGQRILCVAGP